MPLTKWWNTTIYVNVNYNHFTGELYGENLDVAAITGMGNMTNQFKFSKGWSAELSGWYRTSGIEGQIYVQPMGQTICSHCQTDHERKSQSETGPAGYFLYPAGEGND